VALSAKRRSRGGGQAKAAVAFIHQCEAWRCFLGKRFRRLLRQIGFIGGNISGSAV
jgi:hypothetical protein